MSDETTTSNNALLHPPEPKSEYEYLLTRKRVMTGRVFATPK
jgi:hypothetical protein